MSNGFIRLCSMVFCWAAISACHALRSSHMTNKDDDDEDVNLCLYRHARGADTVPRHHSNESSWDCTVH